MTALIVDPDNLQDAGTDSANNIFIDTANRTILIRNNEASGNANKGPVLSANGVTHQALYSFLKEQWKDDPKSKGLINYPFPLIAITPEQFEWRYGWRPADDTSRSLIRTGGWREYAINNSSLLREYIGTISLGNIEGTAREEDAGVNQHKVYYAFFDATTKAPVTAAIGATARDYTYSGEVNEAVQTYLDSNGDGTPFYDYRSNILRLFIRSQPFQAPNAGVAYTFDQTDTVDIGISAGATLPYNTQRFPLVEGQDLKINVTDAVIDANQNTNEKYAAKTGPSIEYLAVSEASNTFGYGEDLFGGPFNYGIKVNAQDGTGTGSLTNQEVYSWTQYSLRQDSDIELATGTVKIGKLQDELFEFVGDTLTTKLSTNLDQSGTKTGVAITNINGNDINLTQLRDDNGTLQAFPFSTNISITFSQDILDDSSTAKAFVFYDYTREYAVGAELTTSITVAGTGAGGNVGASVSQSVATQDSATITFANSTFTPLLTAAAGPRNPEGLDAATEADAYFRISLNAGSGTNHNTIMRVTKIYDSNTFSAITLDDDQTIENAVHSTSGDAILTHPINSPAALILDSAGATTENNVAQRAETTLANANLIASTRYEFSYAFDNNSQKDRRKKFTPDEADNVDVVIRALGLKTGTWAEATGTITKQNTNAFSLVSPVERNYSNP